MSGKIYYRKLIRDRIPEKIAKAGAECETRVLDDAEYASALLAKAEEEASAFTKVTTKEDLVREVGDLLDVLDEIRRYNAITDEELAAARAKEFETKGGFEKKLFLEWSSDDGYQTNEKRSA